VSSTTENYLKKIYAYTEETGDELVGLGEIAQALSVTPGTVTTMMKNLDRAGFVEYRPRSGVRLTDSGRRIALDVIRRHRLIELFLVKTLGLDWSEVHDEAEVLEHSISDRLINRIDEMLGHPTTDPHGDPIPGSDLSLGKVTGVPLSECAPPGQLTISRVSHQPNEFLTFLTDVGLVPGATIQLVARDLTAETITVDVGGVQTALSLNVAGRITVLPS
jgi:DtxR family Mn-dependent transcriptional regulator